jgi:cytochrome c oxidase subunit I+III
VTDSPPFLALICTLVANGTLFTSLVFGTFYLWIAAPNWPAAVTPEPSRLLALVTVVALAVAAAAARGSLRAAAAEHYPHRWIGVAVLALVIAIAADVTLIAGVMPRPTEHALGATAAALLTYVGIHAGIGLLFLISNVLRIGAGFISPRRLTDLRLTRLWIDYTVATGIIALGLVLALPGLVAMLGARP